MGRDGGVKSSSGGIIQGGVLGGRGVGMSKFLFGRGWAGE